MNSLVRNISIIGSGPSGLYTAYHLIKKANTVKIPFNIKVWEKFPVPFGLSRFGVAPDHPEVKNCELTFESMFKEYKELSNGYCQNLEFIGNTIIGNNNNNNNNNSEPINRFENRIPLNELHDSQDVIVFSYGCNGDKRLNIPNEKSTPGVFTSRQFVNWYNGQFDMSMNEKFMNFDWSRVSRVGIIGNGNVALDLSRVLISNQIDSLWSNTDISNIALKKLREAHIESVQIFGRRDFSQSKFTNKEFRELWELEKFGIFGNIESNEFRTMIQDVNNKTKTNNYDRVMMRRLEMSREYMLPFDQRTKKNYKKFKPPVERNDARKIWEFQYLKSPQSINVCDDDGSLKSVTFTENIVGSNGNVNVQNKPTTVTYDLDLLITSLGYKGEPLEGFKEMGVHFENGHIKNIKGRVCNPDGLPLNGLYTSGWISNGGRGIIANTMQESFQVADQILADLPILPKTSSKETTVSSILHNTTSWKDWEKINQIEMNNGVPYGKPRSKFLTVDSVMKHIE
ncbi:similar to Saccharomyces cerevisiae YDR376W ARH1 Oxidoreductase of the mitochondrial inner membrane [Maudiozyma barnettii]|uniref:NADPH:adrenodoxin oxidoreductase, mitochondrial n=1 Tax=Maudiozyma barnettii TaxID=61262 RepID=A0A8H2ZGK3_9SACH|nr:NADPH-adrenodoxin reductase [Kazachstania barnettii]CAB4253748.1 similar to Saccharomyces cerevisiae YDR376W ARH1 Oxidoreductase of the mitochondrial inner membrane [Kazachstania barnettii]CAD1781496.1 similar to Saccharomyces cerevisiae YDR376W ARH1 Oxidoreductase of the mitochondrial inner membrane [Kazachstania barnettii]